MLPGRAHFPGYAGGGSSGRQPHRVEATRAASPATFEVPALGRRSEQNEHQDSHGAHPTDGYAMTREHGEGFTAAGDPSQNSNVKLRDIASAVVTSITGEPPRPAPPFEEGRP